MEAEYIIVCGTNEIGENQICIKEINGKNIVITQIDGQFYAIENNCTHENLPFNGGQIYQGQIQCPHHGARFDIITGKATQIPAVMDIKTYKVKVDNENIMVAI